MPADNDGLLYVAAVTPELYGLVGVVIGGLLGGAAQIVANGLQSRNAHQEWRRDQRFAAYTEFASEWERLFRVSAVALQKPPSERGDAPDTDLAWRLVSRVALLADEKTSKAASEMTLALGFYVRRVFDNRPDAAIEEARSEAVEHRAAFRRMVRRDVNL